MYPENFMAIALWNKIYSLAKYEKTVKICVPTCPEYSRRPGHI